MAGSSFLTRALAAAALLTLAPFASAQGLAASDDAWPRWQARAAIGLSADTTAAGALRMGASAPPGRVHSMALYGDYYFSLPSLGASTALGGFRATSGLIVGPAALALGPSAIAAGRGRAWALGRTDVPSAWSTDGGDTPSGATPYVGLGYTRLSRNGGWGFSADVGLVAQNPSGAWRAGRSLFAPQNLDDAVRNLRLTPLVHVDVRYAF